ncbi:uncharacterized protein PV09_05740 [Verruconis gallopava]|uniref:Uncharacterized protein n=1 Tax=Verruconis gallopava TaxID=253628 RepID=A0A0D2A967_9PEZI|nr:uncharacterized protein PV09_05740 [Verruconis gallopava]KIW03095.1 hypothetical protein PV09_05740 [Verruconis gallopava]
MRHDQANPSFLSLPRELRDRVYDFYTAEKEPFQLHYPLHVTLDEFENDLNKTEEELEELQFDPDWPCRNDHALPYVCQRLLCEYVDHQRRAGTLIPVLNVKVPVSGAEPVSDQHFLEEFPEIVLAMPYETKCLALRLDFSNYLAAEQIDEAGSAKVYLPNETILVSTDNESDNVYTGLSSGKLGAGVPSDKPVVYEPESVITYIVNKLAFIVDHYVTSSFLQFQHVVNFRIIIAHKTCLQTRVVRTCITKLVTHIRRKITKNRAFGALTCSREGKNASGVQLCVVENEQHVKVKGPRKGLTHMKKCPADNKWKIAYMCALDCLKARYDRNDPVQQHLCSEARARLIDEIAKDGIRQREDGNKRSALYKAKQEWVRRKTGEAEAMVAERNIKEFGASDESEEEP